jgi:hypothetical protein
MDNRALIRMFLAGIYVAPLRAGHTGGSAHP